MARPAVAVEVALNPALVATAEHERPKKLVLLPPQVFVYEISAGGVPTRKSDWEQTSRDNFTRAAQGVARSRKLFEVVTAPELDPAFAEVLDAHMGLYERVAQSIFVYGRGEESAWAHKKNQFDYTLGPGLAFLRESTGADAALIVLGADFISSGGRRAAFIAGLALGIVMPLGQSFFTAGVIDLKSGDVQWMSFDSSLSLDSREAGEVNSLMTELYRSWPGQR